MALRLLIGFIVLSLSLGLAQTPRPAQAGQFVLQIDMFGYHQVPAVDTVAWGYVRFFFDDSRRNADYSVDVKGLSNTLVLGADIHRGPPGVNGPIVAHLTDGNFIVTAGRLQFSAADLDEFMSGNWYVSVKSSSYPEGEMRGQIFVPANFLTGTRSLENNAADVAAQPFGPQPAAPLPYPQPAPRPNPPIIFPRSIPVAVPAGAQLQAPVLTCGDATNVTLTWTPSRAVAIAQWLDLSDSDNGFLPASFWGVGPLPPQEGVLLWRELNRGATYFWRITTLLADGSWLVSETGVSPGCS